MNREKLLQNPLPIDRVASRVVYGKAEHWTPLRLAENVLDDLPPLVDLSTRRSIELHPDFVDLTGWRFGCLVAVGLHAEASTTTRYLNQQKHPENARWVCRCPCGGYVLRRAKAIKSNASKVMQCGRCERKRKLRNPYYPGLVRRDEIDDGE